MNKFHFSIHALLAFLFDAAALFSSWLLACVLLDRGSTSILFDSPVPFLLLGGLMLQSLLSASLGVYQGIWRYTSLPDLQRIVGSVRCV